VPERPTGKWWNPAIAPNAMSSINDPDVYAVLMTGRSATHAGIRYRVSEILTNGGYDFDEVHLKTGRAGSTLNYKGKKLHDILTWKKGITEVEIWDDRHHHLPGLSKVVEKFNIPVKVHEVTRYNLPVACTPEEFTSLLEAATLERYIQQLIREQKDEELPIRQSIDLRIPADLADIHKRMKGRGKKLYVVGGAVRDTLMNKSPKDYDVATDATPDEVIKILQSHGRLKLDLTGKSFGVVRVKTPEGGEYEIATFREDIGKGRRPDAVSFSDIQTDVKRRDLTINALFYDMDTGEAVDYVGGIKDIEDGVIRAVGDPAERFDEDRLRILRAVRFAARMGSDLDPETKHAILDDNDLIDVSPDRIKDEFFKGIKSAKDPQHFLDLTGELKLYDQIFPGLKISTKSGASKTPAVQVALLLDENNPSDITAALKPMRYSKREMTDIIFLVKFKNITKETAPDLKKIFNVQSIQPAHIEEYSASRGKPSQKAVQAFLKFATAPPAANAQDLMSQGLKGAEIGVALSKAEEEAYAGLTNEQILRRAISIILNEGVEFRTLDSPLTYNRAGNVKRIALCDTSVEEPNLSRDAYFNEYQEMERYGASGRKLKKPRKGKLVPGVSDACVIGFLDYHKEGVSSGGSDMWYIDYMKTRGDKGGQGTASMLIDEFYNTVAKPGDNVSFGKMMRKEVGHLKDKMVDKYPEVSTRGAVNF
jgi:tRNA nucleotidyltransferase/poly(A) polymerase